MEFDFNDTCLLKRAVKDKLSDLYEMRRKGIWVNDSEFQQYEDLLTKLKG